MRKVLAFAALGLVLSVTAASAQGGGGGRRGGGGFGQGRGFGGGGGLMLLNIPEVRTELKMTDPQVQKLQDVQQKMREERQNSGFDFQNATPEERQAFQKKMQESQTKAISDVLDTKQQKRLHQIELQQPGALNRPDVQAELKITDDQKAKMREIQQAQMEAMRNSGFDFRNASDEERQAFFKKIQDAQKTTNEKILAILTDAQRKQFKDAQGEPFKMPAGGFGFGGPGGRRPGGAGGNPPPPPAA